MDEFLPKTKMYGRVRFEISREDLAHAVAEYLADSGTITILEPEGIWDDHPMTSRHRITFDNQCIY